MNIDMNAIDTVINGKLRQEGGLTLSIIWSDQRGKYLVDLFEPSSGYQIGGKELTPPVQYSHVVFLELPISIRELTFQPNKEYYVGFWLDDGCVHIDHSLYHSSLESARETANYYKQKAIYDWARGKDILVHADEAKESDQHVTQKEPSYESTN